jgi:PAS domain S-box-containing protein
VLFLPHRIPVLTTLRKRLRFPWPTASLRTYLVSAMLVATLPIAALMAWQIVTDIGEQRMDLSDNLTRSASALAHDIEGEVATSIDALNLIAHTESPRPDNIAQFQRALTARLLRRSWSSVFLLESDGSVVFDTAPPGEHRADVFAAGPDFKRIVGQRFAGVSNLATGSSGQAVTIVAAPVMVDQKPRYVLGARIDAAFWQDLLHKGGAPRGGFATVSDAEHRVIAGTMASDNAVGLRLADETIASMARGPFGLLPTGLADGGHAYAAWQPVPMTGWSVLVGVPAGPVDAANRRAIGIAAVTAGGFLLLGLALALFVAARVAGPLQQLARKGTSQPFERIQVREIALLRDALHSASQQDELARQRLQTKADEFETLFNSSPIGLAFAQDPQCRTVLHNAAMDRIFGLTHSHWSGAVQVLRQGQPLERSEQPLQRAASTGEAVPAMELEIVIGERPSTFVLANAVPLRDANGRPRGAIGAVVDITERKQAEARLLSADQRLRESQHLVDLAQEAGHVGFFHYQFEQDTLAWTPGLAKLFGLEVQQAQGALNDWIERVDDGDRQRIERSLRNMIARREQKQTLEFRVTAPAGASRWLSSRVLMSYSDDDGSPLQIIGITVDMSEQKKAERERAALIEREQAARLEAERANRAKDEFMAMLGHELRNPLSAIASAVEVLNRVDARTEVAANARNIIARQTRHLAHMMDDLLDMARIISGKVLLSRHPLNLATLVQRAVATVEVTGEAHDHELKLQLQEVWVDADSTRIEQVLNNLLTNALKYTPAGGRIEVEVSAEGPRACLQVRDTGVGIPTALLPRIFDLFVQGERTLDRRAGGLGIGLTLVRRLVELHGGTIAAASSPTGTTFTMYLPAVEAPGHAHERDRIPDSRRRRIAVIEDNEDALVALCSLLELDGHSVCTATDGPSGLATLLESRPDVAVVDIGLPGLTGFEVAKRSRAAGYAGRMIALSGYGQGRDVEQALTSGFDAHLVKPVDPDQLRRMLADD